MGDDAIRAIGLGKQFHLGTQSHARGMHHAFETAVGGWLDRFRGKRESTAPQTLWALRDVDFRVRHGELVGLVGHNGAGKSVLLKILSRITFPTEGHAEIAGRVGSMLEVGAGFHPEFTGRENIFLVGAILGMSPSQVRKRFDEIAAFAEVDDLLDTPVKRYSSGMYVRLAFSVAAHLDTNIMLFDEVISVGDDDFRAKCQDRIREMAAAGRTIIFVSHNLRTVAELCPRVLLLDHGALRFDGSVADAPWTEGTAR